MVDSIKKSVNVTDLGGGRSEISYKSLPNAFQRLFALIMFFCFAPIGCLNISNQRSNVSELYFFIFIAALALFLWLVWPTTDKLEVTPDALKFSGTSIPWTDIDYFGCQGKTIHVVCSGTRVNIGEALNADVATAVRDRMVDYSKNRS
jgi:hypothetical protein